MNLQKSLHACGKKNFIRYFIPVKYLPRSEAIQILVADGFDRDSASSITGNIASIINSDKVFEAWQMVDFNKIPGMAFGYNPVKKKTVEQLLEEI